MRRLVLSIGYLQSEQEAVRQEWQEYDMDFDFADDLREALEKLPCGDYICIAVCSDFVSHDDIDALRRVRPIPIVVLPPEYTADQRYECARQGAAQYIRVAGRRGDPRGKDNLRRFLELSGQEREPLTIITTKDLCFCLEYHTVEVRGQSIDLTAKEFALLAVLISNPKMVFTYAMLFQQVWKEEYTLASKKTLNNHMSSLRRKLKIAPDLPDFIINIHSVGYKYDLS